jgi:hypothetical protein
MNAPLVFVGSYAARTIEVSVINRLRSAIIKEKSQPSPAGL